MATDPQHDPRQRQGKVPTAPHVDSPAQPEKPDDAGLGIDPQQRQGRVPTAPHAGSAQQVEAGADRPRDPPGGAKPKA